MMTIISILALSMCTFSAIQTYQQGAMFWFALSVLGVIINSLALLI